MTKIKKMLLSTLAVASVTTIAASAVSCSEDNENIAKIFLVTDGGSVEDKSFNEQAMEALKTIVNNDKIAKGLYNAPTTHDAAGIKSGYTTAMQKGGVSYIVAPGFMHVDAIKEYFQENGENGGLNFLVVDSKHTINKEDTKTHVKAEDAEKWNQHIAGIEFATNESGFLAGILASRYLVEIAKDASPKVATWGGGPFPGVTDFMTGFANGVEYYNTKIRSADATTPKVKFVLPAKDVDLTNTSFGAGGGKTIADKYIAEGADVILPVAGPQTADLISAINASNEATKNWVKIIGVDTNQSQVYPTDSKYFLSSIEKKIKESYLKVYKKIITDAGLSLDSLKDVNVESDINGLGATTIGTLTNGLTGISRPAADLVGSDNKKVQALYDEIVKNADYIKAAQAPENRAGTWIGTEGTTTWFAKLGKIGK